VVTALAGGIPGYLFPILPILASILSLYGKEITAMLKTFTSPATRIGTIILSVTAAKLLEYYPHLAPLL
jgi:hypothetical protein